MSNLFIFLILEIVLSYISIRYMYYFKKLSHHRIISIILFSNFCYVLIVFILLFKTGSFSFFIIYFLYAITLQYLLYSLFLLTISSLRFQIQAKENLVKYENLEVATDTDRLSDLIRSGIIIKINNKLFVRKGFQFYYLFLIFIAKLTFNIRDLFTINMEQYLKQILINRKSTK
jgi:hypothetical protein